LRSYLGSLGKLLVFIGNAKHPRSGFRIGDFQRQRSRFLCAVSPMVRIAHNWYHRIASPGGLAAVVSRPVRAPAL
jgi:hypothetical protein